MYSNTCQKNVHFPIGVRGAAPDNDAYKPLAMWDLSDTSLADFDKEITDILIVPFTLKRLFSFL